VKKRSEMVLNHAGFLAAYILHPRYQGAGLTSEQMQRGMDYLQNVLDAEGMCELNAFLVRAAPFKSLGFTDRTIPGLHSPLVVPPPQEECLTVSSPPNKCGMQECA
jgi:hypothetical protein